jgi:ribosomal protein S25
VTAHAQATYEKVMNEVPKYKMITPSILSDRLRVRFTPIAVRRRRPGRERHAPPSRT